MTTGGLRQQWKPRYLFKTDNFWSLMVTVVVFGIVQFGMAFDVLGFIGCCILTEKYLLFVRFLPCNNHILTMHDVQSISVNFKIRFQKSCQPKTLIGQLFAVCLTYNILTLGTVQHISWKWSSLNLDLNQNSENDLQVGGLNFEFRFKSNLRNMIFRWAVQDPGGCKLRLYKTELEEEVRLSLKIILKVICSKILWDWV